MKDMKKLMKSSQSGVFTYLSCNNGEPHPIVGFLKLDDMDFWFSARNGHGSVAHHTRTSRLKYRKRQLDISILYVKFILQPIKANENDKCLWFSLRNFIYLSNENESDCERDFFWELDRIDWGGKDYQHSSKPHWNKIKRESLLVNAIIINFDNSGYSILIYDCSGIIHQ